MAHAGRGQEPGLVPGALRYSVTTLHAGDMEGGHFSRRGNRADGSSVAVPLYRHEVGLEYTRVELELLYTVTRDWDLIARLPWERKVLSASFVVHEQASEEQIAAMQRNSVIHHRPTVEQDISDVVLLGRRRYANVFRTGDALAVSAGVSLPTGGTVENPYILGDHGLEHSHIQFGTGTVDPMFESSYFLPARRGLSAGFFVSARKPLYENSKTFKAAPEATIGLMMMRPVADRIDARAEAAGHYQGLGYWDGVRDANMTGIVAAMGGIGASIRVADVSLSIDVRHPIAQRTLLEGDAFHRGTTVIFSVSGRAR